MKMDFNLIVFAFASTLYGTTSLRAAEISSVEIADSVESESSVDFHSQPVVLEPGLYTTPELCGEYVAQGEHTVILQHASDCATQGNAEFPESKPGIFIYYSQQTSKRVLLQPLNPTSFLAKLQGPAGGSAWTTLRQFLYLKSN